MTSSHVSVVSEAAAATHLGCYDEFGTDEVFERATKVRITELRSLAPDGCRERCRENLIYSYAALWVCILFHFYNKYQRHANKNLKFRVLVPRTRVLVSWLKVEFRSNIYLSTISTTLTNSHIC